MCETRKRQSRAFKPWPELGQKGALAQLRPLFLPASICGSEEIQASLPFHLCLSCGSWFLPNEAVRSCVFCGGSTSLPASDPRVVAAKRMLPAEDETPGIPWLQLSPSLAFLFAILLFALGTALPSLALFGTAAAIVPASLVFAGVLEAREDRKARAAESMQTKTEAEKRRILDALRRGSFPHGADGS